LPARISGFHHLPERRLLALGMLSQDFFLPGLHRDFTSFPDHVAWDYSISAKGFSFEKSRSPDTGTGSIGIGLADSEMSKGPASLETGVA